MVFQKGDAQDGHDGYHGWWKGCRSCLILSPNAAGPGRSGDTGAEDLLLEQHIKRVLLVPLPMQLPAPFVFAMFTGPVGRVLRSVRRECLDQMLILGQGHLYRVVRFRIHPHAITLFVVPTNGPASAPVALKLQRLPRLFTG